MICLALDRDPGGFPSLRGLPFALAGGLTQTFQAKGWFPFNVPSLLADVWSDSTSLLGVFKLNLSEPGFYYSMVYSLLIIVFGIRRMKKRRTPYVRAQTFTLIGIQVIPLFLLPYILLPYMGYNGCFDAGFGQRFADALFPVVEYGHGREYWRAFGFVLAWPLFLWNVFL